MVSVLKLIFIIILTFILNIEQFLYGDRVTTFLQI